MLGIVAGTGTAAGISQLSHCTKSRDGIDTTSARTETISGAITPTMKPTLSSGNPCAETAMTTSVM